MQSNFNLQLSINNSTVLGVSGVGEEWNSTTLVNSPIIEAENGIAIETSFNVDVSPSNNYVIDLLSNKVSKVLTLMFRSNSLLKLELINVTAGLTTKEFSTTAKTGLVDFYDSSLVVPMVLPSEYKITIQNISNSTSSVKLAVFAI